MDLIRQFPDISMEVREKNKLRRKIYPRHQIDFHSRYDAESSRINSFNHRIKNLGIKLVLFLAIGSLLIYLLNNSS